MIGSPLPQGSPLAPLSPKHVQSTTKRALKAAQPLRDEVQSKVNKLQNRVTDISNVDGDVVNAVGGLAEKREQAHRHVREEFEVQMKLLEDAMAARRDQLCEMATEHFRLMEEKMKEKRDQLSAEDARIKDAVREGVEALALDDAWFIQAYPDINLEAGSSVVGATRDLLQSKIGGWSVDFNPELRGNAKFEGQMVPAIKAHGQVQQGTKDVPMDNYFHTPVRTEHTTPAHRAIEPAPAHEYHHEEPLDVSGLSVDSIIEAQVQTMMKCVK